MAATERWSLPDYLRVLIASYLSERKICFLGEDNNIHEMGVTCGVPQGSVLGPLLWNLTYNRVLETAVPLGCSIICYADDTIVIAGGETLREARATGSRAIGLVMEQIRALGLEVAEQKTEAILFLPPRTEWPDREECRIRVGGHEVPLMREMKYLGVMLDNKWKYHRHVEYIVKKAKSVALALGRLTPNLRGPEKTVRLLYANVIQSILLYAVPVWVSLFDQSRVHWASLMEVQRMSNARIVMGYRTISGVSACLLSGVLPLDIIARAHHKIYMWKTDARNDRWREEWPPEDMRERAMDVAIREFEELILDDAIGAPSVEIRHAFTGRIRRWRERKHGVLTFWTTQILTGHGSFGKYTKRIQKTPIEVCRHCEASEDSIEHTLESCPAWALPRTTLHRATKVKVNRGNIVETMLAHKEYWKAITAFCGEVMAAKAKLEREEEAMRNSERGGFRVRPKRKRLKSP